MSQIYLCFLWHMHQPFYKDLVTGQYHLPLDPASCTQGLLRMVCARRNPENPSDVQPGAVMMVQVAEYDRRQCTGSFSRVRRQAGGGSSQMPSVIDLDDSLRASGTDDRPLHTPNSTKDHSTQKIPPIRNGRFRPRSFAIPNPFRRIAWFDEEFLENDPVVRIRKGRPLHLADQA